MSIWSVLRRGLGATDEQAAERARQLLPTFEQLEPRVLLSADPLGLAANDPYDDAGLDEPAIVIEFDPAEPSGDQEQGASPDEATTDSLDRAAADDQAITGNAFGLSLSQIEHASTLPANQLTDEHTLTETALPSGDGADSSSQPDPFTPDMRAAGISEARGPPDGSDYPIRSYYFPQQSGLSELGGFLTGPSAEAPLDIALDYLKRNAADLGLTIGDLDNVLVTDQYVSEQTGVTHIYLRQKVGELEVIGADININITGDGQVINVGSTFIAGLGIADAMTSQPSLTAVQALESLGTEFGWPLPETPRVLGLAGGVDQETLLAAGGVSLVDIPATLHYVPTPQGGVELAWNLIVQTVDGDHWYDANVSTVDGELIYLSDWINDASYEVLALPLENPDDGSRTVVLDPANPTASPFGWHDTDGVAGAEFTDTRGNNVFAQEDRNATDSGLGARPDGGAGLDFDFPLDLGLEPIGYQDAAITNLFYWNNVLHDIHYQYGFDEASGNFQQNNYGNGGLGGDPVQADAQYGADVGQFNNAFFGTPPDGSQPQMLMLELDDPNPNRDSDLSNMIIIHEYGHGVSNRLTGGPTNVNALNAVQSGGMGEGWSDWWGLMLTQKPTDSQFQAYSVGTYVLDQPQNGSGLRRQPYSFDMGIDPLTYGDFNGGPPNREVHNAGEIWASALWDLNWLLINGDGGAIPALGFDADLYSGTGGNNLALQLVMDGLKLQPANPSFLDARDAILLADQVANSGANHLAIWTAFARRGMGASADDGGSGNATTIVEAFDLPGTNVGSVEFDAAFYEVGDTVTVEVHDINLTGGGPINLAVVSDGGDSETLTLAELEAGVFQGSIATAASGAASDGTLNVLAGDVITATYNDLDDGTGNPAVVTDTGRHHRLGRDLQRQFQRRRR